MSTENYSEQVFARQDVSVIAYKDDQSPKPNVIVDYEGLEVTVYTAPSDGKLVIQVEAVNQKQLNNLRVQLGENPLYTGRVSNVSKPKGNTDFTVLFSDGQTYKRESN